MLRSRSIFCYTVLLLFLAHGCGEESTPVTGQNQTSYEGTILTIGDSLTEGLGVEEEFAYPSVLQRKLFKNGYMYKVVNAGVSGETSSGALSRIKWALTLEPDIVILATGANDGLRGIDPELIKTNISTIIQVLQEKDIVVVLGGMRMVQNLGQDYTTAFAEIYPQIAQEQDVILIPFFLAAVGGKANLNQADGIHPTAEGYRIMVENVYPFIIEAIRLHRSKRR